jgi:hypothetical protein
VLWKREGNTDQEESNMAITDTDTDRMEALERAREALAPHTEDDAEVAEVVDAIETALGESGAGEGGGEELGEELEKIERLRVKLAKSGNLELAGRLHEASRAVQIEHLAKFDSAYAERSTRQQIEDIRKAELDDPAA